jgi:predicted AAA+ superfamily ATPase
MLKRFYSLENYIKAGKVTIIYGARRTGKTTLLENYLVNLKEKYKLDSGDNIRVQQIFNSRDPEVILGYAEGYKLIAIDEAQQISDIGMGLKILIDHRHDLKVIATGSSSFELSQQTGEPLTGRKRTLILYPLAQLELLNKQNEFELRERLEDFLIFGSYPEVLTAGTEKEKKEILNELVGSYLFKDIFSLEKIKGTHQIFNLTKLLAHQIGKEVSLNELAAQVKLDIKTVDKYLWLLEKAFILKKVTGFSRNLRKEVVSKAKYYFCDTGIRNAVISQYNKLNDRNDAGELFENFLFIERLKRNDYYEIYCNSYFWRTYDQKEIDLIEEREGKLFAFEFKWKDRKIKVPKDWAENYPNSEFNIIDKQNYFPFITKP